MTIKQKQCLLAYLGTLAPEDIDGLWGGVSAAATNQAQNIICIPADGVWGPQTDAAIREYIFSGKDIKPEETAPTGDWWDGIRYWTGRSSGAAAASTMPLTATVFRWSLTGHWWSWWTICGTGSVPRASAPAASAAPGTMPISRTACPTAVT